MDSNYLYYYFQNAYESLRRMGHGANQSNLSAEILRSVRVPVPSDVCEQKGIANALGTVDQGIDISIAKRAHLAELFRTLLHQLMTAQIRVADLDLSILDQSVKPEPVLA